MIGRTLLAGMLTMTMACTTVPPEEEDVPQHGGGATCNAAPVQDLIGRTASQELGQEAVRRSGAQVLRWIPPGGMVTMDYRPDRLNIELDAQNRVTALRCG